MFLIKKKYLILKKNLWILIYNNIIWLYFIDINHRPILISWYIIIEYDSNSLIMKIYIIIIEMINNDEFDQIMIK